MRLSRAPSGFTIVEMLVALAILAILATMAVPAFNEFFEKSRLRGAADNVVNFVNAQRLAAVKFDREVHTSIRGSGNAWCIGARMAANPGAAGQQVPAAVACDCANTPGTCLVDGEAAVFNSASLGGANSRPSIDAADISLTFDGRRGTLTNFANAGDVTISSTTARWKLRVDVLGLGQARTCYPSDSLPMGGYNPC